MNHCSHLAGNCLQGIRVQKPGEAEQVHISWAGMVPQRAQSPVAKAQSQETN